MMRFTTVLSSLCLFLLPVSAHAGDCMERDWDDACYDEPSDTMLLEIDAKPTGILKIPSWQAG